jgi:hypothetical protein
MNIHNVVHMSSEQMIDLIINYAYSRKEAIQKHRVLLGHEQSSASSRKIDDEKIMEIENWIRFLIDIKNGKLDLSNTAKT